MLSSLLPLFALLLHTVAATDLGYGYGTSPPVPSSSPTKGSKGCSKPDGTHGSGSENFVIESKSGCTPRNYRVHIPASYKQSEPVPLIFSFHGRTKTMEYQEELSQFSDEKYGFEGVTVYPEGVPSKKGTLQWQGDPDSHGIDDIKFTLELLDEIQSQYCIDTSRVYATGKSNGAGFTTLLACDQTATTKFAAFAPVSAAIYLDDKHKLPKCSPTKSRDVIPIMEFHGYKDTTIKYDGGKNTRGGNDTASVIDWVHTWVERDGFKCRNNVTEKLCTKNAEKVVTKYSWGDDAVVHYNYTNMKHNWMSDHANADTDRTTCKETDATRVILEWFKKWSL